MKRIAKSLVLSAVASSMVIAGGYKIPQQSLNSMALRYQQTENLSWGAALLHTAKEGISLRPGENSANPILAKAGSFTGGGATLITVGISYEV